MAWTIASKMAVVRTHAWHSLHRQDTIILVENLRKSRQGRAIDAYLHYRQKELLELERANDLSIHTNADGVMLIATAVKHEGAGAAESGKCSMRIQHGQESGRCLEELISLQTKQDPKLVEMQVAQLVLERAQSQCATYGKVWPNWRDVGTNCLGQQCVQCYQRCGRMEMAEEDATNTVVIPVIMREPISSVDAYHYC